MLCTVPERVSGPPPGAALGLAPPLLDAARLGASRLVSAGRGSRTVPERVSGPPL